MTCDIAMFGLGGDEDVWLSCSDADRDISCTRYDWKWCLRELDILLSRASVLFVNSCYRYIFIVSVDDWTAELSITALDGRVASTFTCIPSKFLFPSMELNFVGVSF